MQTLIDIGTLIVQTPGVCGGRPRIAGHRLTVHNVAIAVNSGMTPEEILAEKPLLTRAEIYAALAYYYANQAAIDADIQADDLEFDQLEAEYKAQRL